ncbi:MAG: VOC family protein [Chloroflexota bacterium]
MSDHAAKRAALEARYLKPRAARPPSSARGVHHVAMICQDVDETIQFYQDVLGFPLVEVMENRDYPGSTHFFLDIGHDNLLAFFDFPGLGLGPAVETIGSLQHLAISIARDQFDAAKARLDARGISYLGPDRGAETSVYLKDPNGIQIELIAEPLLVQDGQHLGAS